MEHNKYQVYNKDEEYYFQVFYEDISKWCMGITWDFDNPTIGSSMTADSFNDLYDETWIDDYLNHYKKYVIDNNSSVIPWNFDTSVIAGFNLDDIPEDWICTYYHNNLAPSFMNKNKTREFYILDHMHNDIVMEFGEKKSTIEYSVNELKNGDWERSLFNTEDFSKVIKEMEEN